MEDLEGKEDGGWKNVEWKKMKDGRCRGERGEGWKLQRGKRCLMEDRENDDWKTQRDKDYQDK